jgi:hypothetical protein
MCNILKATPLDNNFECNNCIYTAHLTLIKLFFVVIMARFWQMEISKNPISSSIASNSKRVFKEKPLIMYV